MKQTSKYSHRMSGLYIVILTAEENYMSVVLMEPMDAPEQAEDESSCYPYSAVQKRLDYSIHGDTAMAWIVALHFALAWRCSVVELLVADHQNSKHYYSWLQKQKLQFLFSMQTF